MKRTRTSIIEKVAKKGSRIDFQDMKQVVLGEKDLNEVMELRNKRLAKKKDILAGRNEGGSLCIKWYEMSQDSFFEHAQLMNQINEHFQVPLDQSDSRPRLRALNMSESCIATLHSLFFDKDGSLRNGITNDIDVSKLGYINFSNTCSLARNDERWQVPIHHHSECTNAIKSALEDAQVVFPDFEKLDNVALLIAGTEDQPLHHDVARAFTSWVPPVKNGEEGDPLVGWEVGRIDYNKAMASPHAPSSIILGMGEGMTVLLGVQKDQIQRVSSGKCTVVGGTGETFDIERETKHLVVIKAEHGFMFTGDFPHAGVRNVLQESPENDLVELFKERISSILDKNLSSLRQSTAILNMLCDFPGLNKLCRFHCTTQLLDGKMKPPLNTVGFTGCLPNPPHSFKGNRGPDVKKRKTRSCQVCKAPECAGRTCRKLCVTLNGRRRQPLLGLKGKRGTDLKKRNSRTCFLCERHGWDRDVARKCEGRERRNLCRDFNKDGSSKHHCI